MSRAHFTRVFTHSQGLSPAEYVLNERMRRAANLLVSGGASVKQVSRDCGFADPNYFAKAFRKSYGASPTEFRTTGMYAGTTRRHSEREAHIAHGDPLSKDAKGGPLPG